MNRRKPIKHSTIGGYRAHYRHGEEMCEPCRDAERKRHGYKAPQKQAVCGTRSGYSRHVQRGEETCPACRAVNAQDRRRVARTGLPEGDPRHGTVNGYGNYGCRCEPCKQAGAENNRQRRAKRAAA